MVYPRRRQKNQPARPIGKLPKVSLKRGKKEDNINIYFARPITGCSADEVINYYSIVSSHYGAMGAKIFQPMLGKGALKNEKKFKSVGYETSPCATNHAILQRDLWMVEQADVVLLDLSGAKTVSIGCCMELAIAHWLRKYTLVVMPEDDNPHNHAFVLEAADAIFKNREEAFTYLDKLIESQSGKVVL